MLAAKPNMKANWQISNQEEPMNTVKMSEGIKYARRRFLSVAAMDPEGAHSPPLDLNYGGCHKHEKAHLAK
jgi:hypothetical protein